jgi:hypothetical protein
LTVLTQAKKSSHLRDSKISILSETPSRNLQSGATSYTADVINEAIAATLPTINGLIQAAIPDPHTIGETVSATATASGTPCDGQTLTIDITFESITGQNTTELTSLTVIEGTEDVSCGCPTTFTGQFNFVGGASSYTLTGPVSMKGESGSCAAAVDATYTTTMTNPAWTGTVTLAGSVDGDTVSIDSSSVDSLTVTVESQTVVLSDISGSAYTGYEAQIIALVEAEAEKYIDSDSFQQIIKDAINSGISATLVPWGFASSASYILRFAGANLGNTVGTFFGFGK